jgi:hypothetical protein
MSERRIMADTSPHNDAVQDALQNIEQIEDPSFLPSRSGSKIGAVTMGLSAFARREIEFGTMKLALPAVIDMAAGLAAYLVEHGGVIKDGDIFGGDEQEYFKVRYKVSDRFAGLPVRWEVGIKRKRRS